MLFYLDNWLSTAPDSTSTSIRKVGFRRAVPMARRIIRPWGPFSVARPDSFVGPGAAQSNDQQPRSSNVKQRRRGLNENYGRELMELHTVGVNGGYSQQDVIEVARCLTGWTIDRPQQGGHFIFRPRMHDWGEKTVLGHRIPAGQGLEDGLEVIHILAHHPSTAHFISLKLCRRFVADDPPESLVDRASRRFLQGDGDIGAVLKTILTSPEFYSQGAYRAKMKSPVELVASSLRALGGDTDAGLPLLRSIALMGEPLFHYQAPTGFPDRATTWVDSGSLLMRMNFAILLATNRIRGTQVDWKDLVSGEDRSSAEALIQKLDGALTRQTRETILHQVASVGSGHDGRPPVAFRQDEAGGADARQPGPCSFSLIAALVLASPEFQKR